MKWQQAVELGEACGLHTPEEIFLNVDMHALSLFNYDKISAEMEELYRTAYEAGVKFNPRCLAECEVCGGITWHEVEECLRCRDIKVSGAVSGEDTIGG